MNTFFTCDFNVTDITAACFVPPGKGAVDHRDRASYGLAMGDGVMDYRFRDRTVTMNKNDIIFLPKHSDYHVDIRESGGCYAINFALSEEVDLPPFAFRPKNAALFLDCFKKAERIRNAHRVGAQMACKAELYRILYEMQREASVGYLPNDRAARLLPAVDHIHTHYTEGSISVTLLSRLCGISEAYFRSLFLKVYGMPPSKYITALRISRAKELIDSGLYSIEHISTLCGFSDSAYFSRVFRKNVGHAPSRGR